MRFPLRLAQFHFVAFLFLSLLPSLAQAEVKAVIKAPTQSKIGNLVIVDSADSIGDNKLWVIDPRLEGLYFEFGDKLIFATGTAGHYHFQLIVADTTAAIAQTQHVVSVGTVGPPPTDPTDPDPPVDPPPPTSNVKQVSQQSAKALDDPATTVALAAALTQAVQSTATQPPSSQKAAVRAAIETTLLNRKGISQTKDWLGGWRVPVDAAVNAANPQANYIELIKQAIEGLNAVSSNTIVMATRPNCPPCDAWKLEVAPKLRQLGWIVVEQTDLTIPTPTFYVFAYGQSQKHEGYMSVESFTSLISSMKN